FLATLPPPPRATLVPYTTLFRSEGPQGAYTLTARIEAMLGEAGTHFHGRLLLITENSYRHRLFNGDIGICLRGEDGAVMAWFPGDTPDTPRAFHPAGVPPHDSAFAITARKPH